MAELSDDELDRLLQRGRLGQEHKQRILRGVLASVQASEPRRWRNRWRRPAFAVLCLSGALAVAALWVHPARQPGADVRDKGVGAQVPIIAMSCLGASLDGCPTGSRIAFWLEGGPKEPGFVTAYADPAATGQRIWLLTNQVAPKAALIGEGQQSGRYRVTVVLTRRPVAHAEVPRLPGDVLVARATFDLVVSP